MARSQCSGATVSGPKNPTLPSWRRSSIRQAAAHLGGQGGRRIGPPARAHVVGVPGESLRLGEPQEGPEGYPEDPVGLTKVVLGQRAHQHVVGHHGALLPHVVRMRLITSSCGSLAAAASGSTRNSAAPADLATYFPFKEVGGGPVTRGWVRIRTAQRLRTRQSVIADHPQQQPRV